MVPNGPVSPARVLRFAAASESPAEERGSLTRGGEDRDVGVRLTRSASKGVRPKART